MFWFWFIVRNVELVIATHWNYYIIWLLQIQQWPWISSYTILNNEFYPCETFQL